MLTTKQMVEEKEELIDLLQIDSESFSFNLLPLLVHHLRR